MCRTQIFTVVALVLLVAGEAHAQSNIDELLEQTAISAGRVAMRDVPGWHAPKKIIVRDIYGSVAALADIDSGVELIAVSSAAEALAQAADADAIIGYCSNEVVAAAPQATWVQVYSAGAESCMHTARIVNNHVVLTNGQKLASPAIAEHAIAMLFALARRLPQFVQLMPDGAWSSGEELDDQIQTISGKTILVVGLGGIGTEIARRAAALDMRVITVRRSSREGPDFVDYVGLSNEIYELASQADYIVDALPLTKETTGFFDAEFFAAAKIGARFINIGRGGTVVTADLVAALRSGQIGGAGLDVTDPEPLPQKHPLWGMENVIITPHVASSGANRGRRNILLQENLRRFIAGDALLNVVDPQLGY